MNKLVIYQIMNFKMNIVRQKIIIYFIGFVVSVLAVSTGYGQEAEGTQGSAADKTSSISCEPSDPGVDIIHFPMKRWTENKDRLKVAQETVDVIKKGVTDALDFVEGLSRSEGQSGADINLKKDVNQSTDIVESSARYQFKLIQLIRRYPYSFVFHEFVTRIYNLRHLDHFTMDGVPVTHPDQLPDVETRGLKQLFQLSNAQFPDGVPETYAELSEDQKHTLAIIGGVHTLFFLKELPVIFPSISQSQYQRIFNISRPNSTRFYYETLFCANLLSCLVDDNKTQILKAEYLSKAVNGFLAAFHDKKDPFYEVKEPAIVVYEGKMNLQTYFPGRTIFRVPDSCLEDSE